MLQLDTPGLCERIVLFPGGMYAKFDLAAGYSPDKICMAVGGGCYAERGRRIFFKSYNCTHYNVHSWLVDWMDGRIGADRVWPSDSVLAVLFGKPGLWLDCEDGYTVKIRKGRRHRNGTWSISRGRLFSRHRYRASVVEDRGE